MRERRLLSGIKISPLDKLFSKYVRSRDRWTCQRCMKYHRPPTNGLHCAHLFGRRNKSTRWDPDNAIALCYGCHQYFGEHPLKFYDWYIKRFGKDQFDRIRLRSNVPVKVDERFVLMGLRLSMKSLESYTAEVVNE